MWLLSLFRPYKGTKILNSLGGRLEFMRSFFSKEQQLALHFECHHPWQEKSRNLSLAVSISPRKARYLIVKAVAARMVR